MRYPSTRISDAADTFGGVTIPDPYRWLEDLDSPDVAAWVHAQNAVTQDHLATLPLREHYRSRLTELWNYPRTSLPAIEANRLFYAHNTGLQRQAALYVRDGLDAPPRPVLDPNALWPDGSLSLSQYSPSPDARLLAYAVAEGGADWETIRVRDVATGTDLGDHVSWVRFSDLSWTHDSRGFFYSRYPAPPPNKVLEAALAHQAVYYHRIGTAQSDDLLIYERRDEPAWIVNATVSDDGRYLLVRTYKGADHNNQLHVLDLVRADAPVLSGSLSAIVSTIDAEYSPIGNHGSRLFIRTDKGAPNRCVVAVDLGNPSTFETVVPEGPHAIEAVVLTRAHLVVHHLVDVQSRLRTFRLDGTPDRDIDLPGLGAVSELRSRSDQDEVWFQFSSPLSPATVYRADLDSRALASFMPPAPPIDASQFETLALFATSKDGTRVPYFLTRKKGSPQDGTRPALIYGYGGFSISVLPGYRPDVPAWLERGGAFVSVNMRGGAEYGEAWHQAGMLDRKQNVFDDFIAVADTLVRTRVTSSDRLAIMGGSNGGLLVGAVMEQRPDLVAVALPAVGVMDMLRYDHFTGGRLWATEYGSASNPDHCAFLLAYSPLHNVRPGTCYPATLVTTADHDDRVVPSHSYKFTAALQAAQGCDRPVLIRVETQGSHGYRPTDRLIAERADQWAFASAHVRWPSVP